MGARRRRCFLGMDKGLRKININAAHEIGDPIGSVVHPVLELITNDDLATRVLPDFNREQWKSFLMARPKHQKITFAFVGHARTMEMVYFLNSLGSQKNIKVILLLAEETKDTSIIDKFNDSVKVVNYWKFVNGVVHYGRFTKELRDALA